MASQFLPFRNSDELLAEERFGEWCLKNLEVYPYDDGTLRFNGLYHAQTPESYDYYLRFYADGTVLSTSVSKPATVEQIARWFGKSHDDPAGYYRRSGAQIAFTTHYLDVSVDYIGAIVDNFSLYLESYSHCTLYRDLRWFHYEPVASLVQ